ncbi:MAG: Ribonuclease Y [Candidatus Wolfebacteria bacterium GW2011_GWA2_42_10]|uniref:Ribonuclease Y n=2 Tax=Candidatus Wolfeibacteriota TaxID=1752735 RepID=A0A0G1AJB6_9BACT|nr:MAG: Ribonuclease Y [Candidatus Wolfebacteria bacterium GW2011_GWB1_41_12]KKS25388.1 MAG: Ribonuclease Y [Candidatus Wolfebacteria bacterium GW2011_GWA2_42_10]KKT56827.1 MAG: Ribonuclease Y [Candidatus Wolfebacteria bacterium GW2011_GWA1_44_24]
MIYQNPVFWGVLVFVGIIAGYFIRQLIAAKQSSSIEQKTRKQFEEAKIKANEIILEARGKAAVLLEETQKSEREQKFQLTKVEERLMRKEELLEKQWVDIRNQENQLKDDDGKIKIAKTQLDELKEKLSSEFERIAKLSETEAREKLLQEIKEKYKEDLTAAAQKLIKERKEEIEKKGAEIMAMAMQRLARTHAAETTTSIFNLEDEELKGKIIGREGRNIRALERETGAEFIIDETPGAIVISSFDPVRREIARLALEKLVKDGRIQPAKIEEKVEEAKTEVNKIMAERGEEAAHEIGVYNLPKEIVQLLGRLHFRTSYGQNVLAHSVECAHLAGMIATELNLNVETAKLGALLHDIGKAIDQEVGGSHVEVGQRILRKFGVKDEIIKAMEAHHEEYPFSSSESYVVAAADALSASRPGARRDTLENYLKRLENLEKIAKEFEGIKNAYAISAGRELRVFVVPEKIDDFGALQLARDIAVRIESELKYPGEIKVNVIREMRAVEYAR